MKISFVNEWNLFMRYARDNALGVQERALWQALFYAMNDRSRYREETRDYDWPDGYIMVSNAEIELYSGLNKKAIERAREALSGRGLIAYIPGARNGANPQYKMRYLSIGAETKPTLNTPDWGQVNARNAAEMSPSCPQNVSKMSPKCLQSDAKNAVSTMSIKDKDIDTDTETEKEAETVTSAVVVVSGDDDGESEKAAEEYGLPMDAGNRKEAARLRREYGADWLTEAIRRAGASAGTKNWRYVEGILRSCRAQGGMDKPRRSKTPPGKTVSAQSYSQREYAPETERDMLLEQLREAAAYAAG